ncbi:inovirus Gp2 family protein [Alicycliphilus denitrificans]|uniref:inovirus Gp2 family protein n=1 Tax=Alicycliphilus denitrificans TaxID=179636 RepID=UPI000A795FC6|nr:inovirus Gp2 family protein [Alicycliphilus denitrificans]MBN9576312.1 inovirus Gp2 family protein [Alicycliphilus denitrificans]
MPIFAALSPDLTIKNSVCINNINIYPYLIAEIIDLLQAQQNLCQSQQQTIMNRHPLNPNLRLTDASSYSGLPIQNTHGPMIDNFLGSSYRCFERTIEQYSRVSMLRFDLHLPEHCGNCTLLDNTVLDRFFSSLKAKITHAQRQSRESGHRVHETEVRYLWAREISATGRVHYHIALLLNHDAYAHFGQYDLASSNIYSRIHQAWASALHMCDMDVLGLIHIPENAIYFIKRHDKSSLEEAFHRASYLCKADSKDFQKKFHCFGSSRI